MRSGASVCPRKILAAAFVLSAAVVPTVLLNNQPWTVFIWCTTWVFTEEGEFKRKK